MAHRDVEKVSAMMHEDRGSTDEYVCEFTPEEQKKIIHRIDRRLVITVGVLYCISLMDRTNLSSAAIAGLVCLRHSSTLRLTSLSSMNVELKLNVLVGSVSRYSIVTLVFFITYIIFQPPSTVIIRKLGPRVHLSIIVTAWGGVMIGMGFAKTWESLAALRVVLGVLEAGFFPSCVSHTSSIMRVSFMC